VKTHAAIASLLFLFCYATSHAVVTFDWATVGNPDNGPDQGHFGKGELGAVARTYRISKYEVTNGQYRDFLNAVDPTGTNSRNLYSSFMGSDPRGGIAFNASAAGGSKYSSKSNMEKKARELRVVL